MPGYISALDKPSKSRKSTEEVKTLLTSFRASTSVFLCLPLPNNISMGWPKEQRGEMRFHSEFQRQESVFLAFTFWKAVNVPFVINNSMS
jgi:hypothetical protein